MDNDLRRPKGAPRDRRKVGTIGSVMEELERISPKKQKDYEQKASVLYAYGRSFRKSVSVYGETFFDATQLLDKATEILNTEGKSDGYKVW